MALGRRRSIQKELFVTSDEIAKAPAHPFYSRLEEVFKAHGFDAFCEELCQPYYADGVGRPGLAPGVYFRLLMLGYFERIPSERQIARRVADSLSLRQFAGFSLTEGTPDHSTISKTRRRLPLSVHTAVFTKVLDILIGENLFRGKKIGVDATTLESNAGMRALTHNISGKSHREYVKGLMAEDPDEPDYPSPDDISRFDRRRKGKKLSNKHWINPHNQDAKITRMKDGRTHFAEKCEQAVDLETGAVVAVTVQGADVGDTTTLDVTLEAAANNLNAIKESLDEQRATEPRQPGRLARRDVIQHVVADKGYHSAPVCDRLKQQGVQPVISEPKTGRRKWKGKRRQQLAFYANRNNIRSDAGKGLMRKRAELVERAFTHYLDAGGVRRAWLKGHKNIAKRLLIQVAGFNLGLFMRKLMGAGTPRAWADLLGPFFADILVFVGLIKHRRANRRGQGQNNCFMPDDYPTLENSGQLLLTA
ncbi:transposase [Thermodesulfobacteriota bacterium]